MAQYAVTGFRWSGTGYNTQYNTSYSVTIHDDDATLQGSADANETVSINGGTFGPGYTINVSFTDTDGDPYVEPFYFLYTWSRWYFVPEPGSAFTVGATLGSYQSHTSNGWTNSTVTCFARGTLIETNHGPVPVERLRTGSMVLSADGDLEPQRLSMSRKLFAQEVRENPKLAPIRIIAGSLGNGMPKRDLLVSPQHRMLVLSAICKRMFGEPDVLVSAIRLTELPGVFLEPDPQHVEYFHLIFDCHKVTFAEWPQQKVFHRARGAQVNEP